MAALSISANENESGSGSMPQTKDGAMVKQLC
jgi:hypothetical protein